MPSPALPPALALSKLKQTTRFFKDPFDLIAQCRRELGEVFTVRLIGMGNWVFISNPEHLKELFKAPPDVLVSGEINAEMLGFLLGKDATFCLDGDPQLRRRKLMLPFFSGKGVLDKLPLIREVASSELDKIPIGRAFPFLPWAMHTSLAVIMKLLFGASSSEELEELTDVFEQYARDGLRSPLLMMPFLQVNLGSFSPWGRVLGQRRKVFAAFGSAIAQRRSHPERFGSRDVVSALCDWRDENGELLSEESIRDEVLTDLFAGHETTAKVLAWALECALAHPHSMSRLQQEIDTALGDQELRAEHLKSLPYTQAFLEEAQRFRPLAPFAGIRRAKQPFQLGRFLIPPGTTLVQGLPILAQDSTIFEDPEVFEPERFLERTMKPFTWNPFGGGRRMCLGKGLAEVELVVFLATLVRRYSVKLAQPKVDRVRSGFFFAPSHDLRVELEARQGSTIA